MPAERFDFANAQGEKLAALLDRPDGPIRAVALFAHCFTCGKDNKAARLIAQGLTSHGIAVLRFDFTGLGRSEGEFANTTFSSNINDLVAAADHLQTQVGAPAILIGHSLGGAAVLAAAHRIAEARAVVTIAAPSDPAHVVGLFGERVEEIKTKGEIEVRLAGRPFRVRRALLDDIAGQNLAVLPSCARRFWFFTRRLMKRSASTMPAISLRRQSIRKASSRSPAPIICWGGQAMPPMSRM
jgi:pimeloyl-ACP methyl ester carboxylesterase